MLNGIWLVRHGAPEAPAGMAIGSSDPPLSWAGKRQARALAIELSARPLAAVYSSDKVRAIATAEAIAAAHRIGVRIDVRLRELDLGAWEGRSLGDLWTEEPQAAAAWEKDLRATPPAFGESVAALEERVTAFLKEACAQAQDEIVVVAHRGSLAALRGLITGSPLEAAFAAGMELGTAMWVEAN